jgi:hypothetical protein
MSSEIVPREKVTKSGLQGVVSTAGGIVSIILAAVTAHPLFGIVVGGIIGLAGLALSSSKHDRTLGVATTVVGGVALVASIFHLGGLLVAGGVVLLGIGAWSLYKFFRGLKSRS